MAATTRRVEANLQVLEKAKTHAEVARVLGYTDRRNVWPWTNNLRPFPPQHCVTLEQTYGISRRLLRPDDWRKHWPELAAEWDGTERRKPTGNTAAAPESATSPSS